MRIIGKPNVRTAEMKWFSRLEAKVFVRSVGQFASETTETWKANSSTGNSPTYKKIGSHGNSLFSTLLNLISLFLVILTLKSILKGHRLDLAYLYVC